MKQNMLRSRKWLVNLYRLNYTYRQICTFTVRYGRLQPSISSCVMPVHQHSVGLPLHNVIAAYSKLVGEKSGSGLDEKSSFSSSDDDNEEDNEEDQLVASDESVSVETTSSLEAVKKESPEESRNREIMQALEVDDFDKLADLIPRPRDESREPVLPELPQSYTLAPYVNTSKTLQALIALGVELYKVERKPRVPEYILSLDFDTQMRPHILFLHDIGVPPDLLGRVITRNPTLFDNTLDQLQVRIQYFQWKRFTADDIVRIVSQDPKILNLPTQDIDANLGYYQKMFHLSGNEVRQVIARCPKLVLYSKWKVEEMRFSFLEEFGFERGQFKEIFTNVPTLITKNRLMLRERFHLLHNVLGMSHDTLISWPRVFFCRRHIVDQRHRFLEAVGRAQYDPRKENFVSLRALVSFDNDTFCRDVAKLEPRVFEDFLRTR